MASASRKRCSLSFLTICLISLVLSENSSTDESHYVKYLKRNDFPEFREKSTVTMIYFFKKEHSLINSFLSEYEKSAAVLNIYNVELAKVDCIEDKPAEPNEYCDKDGTEENLYAFRDGHELIALPLENTFDVDSIVSNILQIVLIRDIPILQTKKERLELEEQNVGKNDILFSFQTAIGTHEHRVLTEVAFAYRNRYSFGMTTEIPVVSDLVGSGSGESAIVWLLKCADITSGSSCTQSKYHDNIDLLSLVRYLRVLDINTIHDISTDGWEPAFEDYNVHEVIMYYNKESREEIHSLALTLQSTFSAVIGIILVDVNHKDASRFMFNKGTTNVPGVTMSLRGVKEPIVMEGEFNSLAVEAFVSQVLDSTLRDKPEIEPPGPMGESEEIDEGTLAGVEKQDDQVAEAVSRLDHVEMDRTHIPVLTDKTFAPQTTESALKIVLFYLTFDARSMAFMRSYIDASFALAKEGISPLAAVDCFDWTDVCGKNNITTYPTIRIYRKGKDTKTYEGMLGTAPIVNLVKLLLADAPVLLSNQEEHDLFVEGTYPTNLIDVTDVAVVGLFKEEDVKELASFKRVAVMEHGKTIFGYSSAALTPSLCHQYGVKTPAIVLHKRHDPLDEPRILINDIKPSKIISFVRETSLSLFPEITPVNFPAYFAQKKPFVLLFDEYMQLDQGAHAEVAAVAATKEFPEFILGWMELTRDDGIGGKVLLEYDPNAEPPSLFVVDHAKAAIYHFEDDMDRHKIYAWLKSVHRGDIKPWNCTTISEALEKGEWKPLNPGYDFLKMIDEENAEDEGQQSYNYQTPPVSSRLSRSNIMAPPGEDEENVIREELHSMQPGYAQEASPGFESQHHTEL